MVAGLHLSQTLLREPIQLGSVEDIATMGLKDLEGLVKVSFIDPWFAIANRRGAEGDLDSIRSHLSS